MRGKSVARRHFPKDEERIDLLLIDIECNDEGDV